jgi:hypothetical protein
MVPLLPVRDMLGPRMPRGAAPGAAFEMGGGGGAEGTAYPCKLPVPGGAWVPQ